MARYIFLDTETTGLRWSEGHRVFEIGMVSTSDFESTQEKRILINPGRELSKESIEICKVQNEELQGYPLFKDIMDEFLEFLHIDYDENEKTVLLAHNAKFDIGFLNNELVINGKESCLDKFIVIDTVKVAKINYPGQTANLDDLCKRLNIELGEREDKGHSALLDCKLLYHAFSKMMTSKSYNDIVNFDKLSENFIGFYRQDKVLSKRTFDKVSINEESHHEMLSNINQFKW